MIDRPSADALIPVPARRSREVALYTPTAEPVGVAQRNVLLVMWDRLWVVLACVAVALAAGYAYANHATPLYSSDSLLYVQQSFQKLMSDDLSSGSMTAINLTTQCQLITSTVIIENAVKLPSVAAVPSIARSENPIGFLKSVVHAQPNKEGELIDVSVTLPDPNEAAALVNGVVRAYIDYQERQHQSNAVQVAAILQRELDSHDKDLKSEQQAMLDLRRKNPQLTSQFDKRDAGGPGGRSSDLTQELSLAQLRAKDLRTALRTAESNKSNLGRLSQIIKAYRLSDIALPSSLSQLSAKCEQQEDALNRLIVAGNGTSNDAYRQAQLELDRTRSQMAQAAQQEAADDLETIRVAADIADAQAKELQDESDAQQKSRIDLNDKEVEYDQLASAAERNERALDALDSRLKDIHFTADVAPIIISVLESAKPNLLPISPNRKSILGESLVGGLVAGLGFALLLERLDHRLRSVDEIPLLIDGPVLGVIPRAIRRGPRADPSRETFLFPRSAVAEAFGTIRTAIYFGGGGSDERPLKTILITSPAPGDGKSTCVSNLAIAVAQAGRRVLLIDADCRRPVQQKTFKVEDTAGLTGVLTGAATLADAVRPTGVDRLDLLQCGPLPHNPAELLDSQALLDLLLEAGRQYDQVLVDSPPINMVSDARVLAANCDAALLVLRAERSTRRGALLAWNVLASVGANRLGAVVNDVTRPTDGYGYAYYSHYGYGYASTKEVNGSAAGPRANFAAATPEKAPPTIIGRS